VKRLIMIVILTAGLAGGCSKQPLNPAGLYSLDTEGRSLTLTVRDNGNYSLKVIEPSGASKEILGRWQVEDEEGKSISFSGVIWQGTDPSAGNGFWKATFEGRSNEICLDGEGMSCFVRNQ